MSGIGKIVHGIMGGLMGNGRRGSGWRIICRRRIYRWRFGHGRACVLSDRRGLLDGCGLVLLGAQSPGFRGGIMSPRLVRWFGFGPIIAGPLLAVGGYGRRWNRGASIRRRGRVGLRFDDRCGWSGFDIGGFSVV